MIRDVGHMTSGRSCDVDHMTSGRSCDVDHMTSGRSCDRGCRSHEQWEIM